MTRLCTVHLEELPVNKNIVFTVFITDLNNPSVSLILFNITITNRYSNFFYLSYGTHNKVTRYLYRIKFFINSTCFLYCLKYW